MKHWDRMDAVMNLTLKGPAKTVLLVLAHRANDKNGKCWPSYKRLVLDTGLNRTTIIRAITRLEGLGLLDVIRSNRKVNKYFLNFDAVTSRGERPELVAESDREVIKETARKPRSRKSSKWCQYHPTVRAQPNSPGLCHTCWASQTPWTHNYGSPDFKTPNGESGDDNHKLN